jgi:hypothetical protein
VRRLEVVVVLRHALVDGELPPLHDLALAQVECHDPVELRQLRVHPPFVVRDDVGPDAALKRMCAHGRERPRVDDRQLVGRLARGSRVARLLRGDDVPDAAVVDPLAVRAHVVVVRPLSGLETVDDQVQAGVDHLDLVLCQGGDVEPAPVVRDRHVVGAEARDRDLPAQPAAPDVERGDVAAVAARDVQRAAVGRHVEVLRVVVATRRLDHLLSEERLGRVVRQPWLGPVGEDVDRLQHLQAARVDEADRAALGVCDQDDLARAGGALRQPADVRRGDRRGRQDRRDRADADPQPHGSSRLRVPPAACGGVTRSFGEPFASGRPPARLGPGRCR